MKHHKPDGVLGRLYVISMMPIRWITRKAVTSSSSSAKKSPAVADEQNSPNKRSSSWWLSLFSGSGSSKKGRKLNNMSSVGKVKPYPIPVTTSKTEDSNHKGGSNAPTTSSSSSAPHYNLAGKVHRASSNFSKSLNHLEESLDAISSSEKIPDKALERNNSFQTVTTATANTSMIDNGSVQYNQSVSIAMESSIDSDWMPSSSSTRRHQQHHHLNNNYNQYSPSSRQRSLFFTVNGNLVQLHETVTTISHC